MKFFEEEWYNDSMREIWNQPMLELSLSEDKNTLKITKRKILVKYPSWKGYADMKDEPCFGLEDDFDAKPSIRKIRTDYILKINEDMDYIVNAGKIKRFKINPTKSDGFYSFIHRNFYRYVEYSYNRNKDHLVILSDFLKRWSIKRFPFLEDIYDKLSLAFDLSTRSMSKIKTGYNLFLKAPKAIKKSALSHKNFARALEGLRAMHYAGFKDNNVILSILEDSANPIIKNYYSEDLEFAISYKMGGARDYLKILREVYTDINPEALLFKRYYELRKNDKRGYYSAGKTMIDVFNMLSIYNYLKNRIKCEDLTTYTNEELAKMSLNDLHDSLMRSVVAASEMHNDPRLRKEISLKPEIQKLNGIVINNHKFIFPIHYKEFLEVGNKMSNCVSTYFRYVIAGETNICYALNTKTNEPDICIELSNKMQVVQCLGNYNRTLPEKLDKVANEFFEAIGAIR